MKPIHDLEFTLNDLKKRREYYLRDIRKAEEGLNAINEQIKLYEDTIKIIKTNLNKGE